MEEEFGDFIKNRKFTREKDEREGDDELDNQDKEHDIYVRDERIVIFDSLYILWDWVLDVCEIKIEAIEVFPAKKWT